MTSTYQNDLSLFLDKDTQFMSTLYKTVYAFCAKQLKGVESNELKTIAGQAIVGAYLSIKKNKNFKLSCKLSTFINQVAGNKCKDYLRKKKKQILTIPIQDEQEKKEEHSPKHQVFCADLNIEAILIEKETQLMVQQAIRTLPIKEQLIIQDNIVKGIPISVIAQNMGELPNTITVIKRRTLQKLKKIILERLNNPK